MKENLIKYKKIGLISIGIITALVSFIIYNTSGFKELNKNNNESIFVDDGNSTDNSKDDNQTNDKQTNIDKKSDISSSVSDDKISASNDKIKDKTIIVEIKGEVKHPDVYTLDENSIINDLINLAGGVTENANLSGINRAKKLQNHEMIYIADKNIISNTNNNTLQSDSKNTSSNIDSTGKMVDINTATVEELRTLNGIGESKAKSIIDYREKNGGFKSIEEIKNVDGIGDKMFEKIKESIIV